MELDYNFLSVKKLQFRNDWVVRQKNEIRDVKIHQKQKASIQSVEKH